MDDLLALEAASLANPTLDLIAAYARANATDIELRFDLLGSPNPADYDFYLALETGRGGKGRLPFEQDLPQDWDLLLSFPAQGMPHAMTADLQPAAIRPRILRSGRTDSITVRLSKKSLPSNWQDFRARALIARPGSWSVADTIGPVTLGTRLKARRAPLLLAFWDGLPAATPAQALRRWDGAHTGPSGQRHGLSILLEAAQQAQVPLVILDLKNPSSLSALDVLGGLPLVREMQRSGQLLLPDLSEPYSDQTAYRPFGLQSSPILYGTNLPVPAGRYRAFFARLADPNHLRQTGSLRIIPLPAGDENESDSAGPDGMAADARRKLLEIALSPAQDELLVLGGSLPQSAWGDSLIATPVMEDIAGHPWIQALDSRQLLSFPARAGEPDCRDLLCLEQSASPADHSAEIAQAIKQAPDNLFTHLARQMVFTLAAPTRDPQLRALRTVYFGQVGPLLAAARWSVNRPAQAACSEDIDWDGSSECLLSNQSYFFVIDPLGARLVLGAAQTAHGPLQIIGQRSQWVTGLGPPQEWRLDAGLAADPEDIPGGFADLLDPYQPYQAVSGAGSITLNNPQNGSRKTYLLTAAGLEIIMESQQPIQTRVPLGLVDSRAFQPGWYASYHATQTSQQEMRWEMQGGPAVLLRVKNASLDHTSFVEALPNLVRPEDPNFSYPEGHYLPFPMAVINIQGQGQVDISLTLDAK